MTYRILDLFCGAGGAAVGYHRAGFEVIGVDLHPQPRYPFAFFQDDALDFLRAVIRGLEFPEPVRIDAIHASPPCQAYSELAVINPKAASAYPKLIEPVRELLKATRLPYVIENVSLAPLRDPVVLCGSQFGLVTDWTGEHYDGQVYLKRHRKFETSFPVPDAGPHDHSLPAVTVAGHGRPGRKPNDLLLRGRGYERAKREVMGIDWMTRDELNESIPPAYTEYVGTHLCAHLNRTSNREAA